MIVEGNRTFEYGAVFEKNLNLRLISSILFFYGMTIMSCARETDQCDQESARAKAVMNSFVKNKRNIKNRNGIFDALHYGQGAKNSKISVVVIRNFTDTTT